MSTADFLKDAAKRVKDVLPPNLQLMKEDLEKNIHSALQSAFAKLDLVTREEFDVQSKVLARTREKCQALEKEVAQLEKRLKP